MDPVGNEDSGNDGYADEIAERYEALNEEQKARYGAKITVSAEAYGELSAGYKLGLLKTYAKNLPLLHEGRDIAGLDGNERARAYEREQKPDRESGDRAGAREANAGVIPAKDASQGSPVEEKSRDPMEGVRPSGQFRDYSELERAREQAAAQNARIIPVENLQERLRFYDWARAVAGFQPAKAENDQRASLRAKQAGDQKELRERQQAKGKARDPALQAALDHQHLAEEAGLEGRLLGQAMGERDPEAADRYLRESREAWYTARLVHERRQYRERTGPPAGAVRGGQGLEARNQDDKRDAVKDVRKAKGRETNEAKEAVRHLLPPGQEPHRPEARREGDGREALKQARNAKGRFGVTGEAKEAVKHLLAARQNTGRSHGGRTGGHSH